MDNMLEIAALNEEARKRNTDYGMLVGTTSGAERAEIILKYERARAARLRREKERRKKKAQTD